MEKLIENAGKIAAEKHPRESDVSLGYGTAGFRTKAVLLDHVLYRMGLLATIRSKSLNGATIGVMITASHNPEEDNGVKLVDPQGEMLEASWESHAQKLANVKDAEIPTCLKSLMTAAEISPDAKANVVFARDTRPSSASLSEALRDGLTVMETQLTDYGILTTPQLHYMVRCINSNCRYGQPDIDGYYNKLAKAFKNLAEQTVDLGRYTPEVTIDGANGVGAVQMVKMVEKLGQTLQVNINNDGSRGKLNHQCGADFVKIQQKGPEGMQLSPGCRYASFDGDADRIVFYFIDQDNTFHLLDGDKIATLVAGYLKELVTLAGIDLDLGLVQTAYANGSSTDYILNKLKVPVACVPTGVKHLHHRALQFDVGVYFEANGHGTVVFSEKAEAKIREMAANSSEVGDHKTIATEAQRKAAEKLASMVDLINQTVGDAISDLLVVEVILRSRGWNIADWQATYTDLPNRQLKVKVADRTVIQTTDAERRTTNPEGLQTAIDKLVEKYTCGRSFVRPSGTEDVVRVYAEANTREAADSLAHEVSVAAYQLAGGVGGSPTRS